MRVLTLIVAASFLLLAFASTGSAAPSVCTTEDFDATLVRGSVTYGGLGCTDASLERCTLESDPEHPGLNWYCHDVI